MPATLEAPPPKKVSRQPAPPRPAAAAEHPRLVGPQTQSLLANDDQFVVIDDVPVFPEHRTKAKDGRDLVFDRTALKALCDNCNRRIVATGDYATIIVGHTVDPKLLREGRAKNPPAVGFAGPYKLGLLGPVGHQRWCIFARFRIYRDKWDEVRQFPRRSPELWLMPTYEEMFLDPIALLSETPRLDMGILYSAQLHAGGIDGVLVEKYAAAAMPSASNAFVPSDKYQGENPMAASADEIVQGVMQALDSCDWVQWCKQQMQAASSPAAQATAPAADVNAPPPPAPEAAPAPGAPTDAPPPPADATAPPAAPPAAPATAPAAAAPAAPPPAEERSKADVDKNAAACPPATPVARVKYDAQDDDDKDGKKDDSDPVVQEKPGDDDADGDDDEDLEPEKDETVEQYRARSKAFRRHRKKGAKINYSANGNGNGDAAHSVLIHVVQSALAPIVGRLDAVDQAQREFSTQLGRDRASMKNIERYAALEGLARQGYAIDPATMLETLKYSAEGGGVSDEEFTRHIEILTKTGNRAPIDAPLLPVPDSIEQYSAQPGGGKSTASNEHRAAAFSLCEKASIAGQTPDYVKTLHNVVSGKNEAALA